MFKHAIRLILVLAVSQNVLAQNLTRSPYSIIGIGDMHFLGTAHQSAMGQVGLSMRKQAEINMLNPASYSALKFTIIEGGLLYSQGTLNTNTASSEFNNSSFSYFAFGVPLHAKIGWGLVFGLSPYSNIGYNVSSTRTYPDFVGTTQVEGTGGLSRFHVGSGIKVLPNVSVGVNMSYIFGQNTIEQKLIIPVQYNKFNIAETRSRSVNDVQWQAGVQYHKDLELGSKKDKYAIAAGATYTLATNLNGSEEYFIRSMGLGQTTGIRDSIAYENNVSGSIRLPQSVGLGVSFEKKEQWWVGVDANYTQWSSFRRFGAIDSLKNTIGVNVGASFIPNSTDYKNYFKRIEYRLGARADNGNLAIFGNNIATYAVSAGFGFPIGKSKTRINLSGEYITRGTTQDGLIREDYFRIVFGINFSDKWFQRYKYD